MVYNASDKMKEVFKDKKPLISFRRPRNLADNLVRSKIKRDVLCGKYVDNIFHCLPTIYRCYGYRCYRCCYLGPPELGPGDKDIYDISNLFVPDFLRGNLILKYTI